MAFTSIYFLFLFLPFVIIGKMLLKSVKSIKVENMFLLILSMLFYAWCGIQYLVMIFVLALVNFVLGEQKLKIKNRKCNLVLSVGIDVFVLLICKYFNFFIENIEHIMSMLGKTEFLIETPQIPLPLGISFIIFQLISFETDKYNGKIEKCGLVEFLLYIFLFPQIIEGPIIRFSEIKQELSQRDSDFTEEMRGLKRFIWGLAKKVLIADQLLQVSNILFETSVTGMPAGYAWIGVVSYAFVIYYDFSGYSDMAIGLCRFLGFRINENFNYPYISRSVQEFWRRWHISLSSWFRDYVYIPLGGNREGTWKTYRNLGIVFLLTGIWHGANWTFLIWGIWHGLFMMVERIGFKKVLDKLPDFWSHVYTMVVVLIGWVFFNANDLKSALTYLKCMFGMKSAEIQLSVLQVFDNRTYMVLLVAFVFSMPVAKRIAGKINSQKLLWIENVCCLFLLVLSVATILSTGFSPSIYTKF